MSLAKHAALLAVAMLSHAELGAWATTHTYHVSDFTIVSFRLIYSVIALALLIWLAWFVSEVLS